jgi:hypothetical protein
MTDGVKYEKPLMTTPLQNETTAMLRTCGSLKVETIALAIIFGVLF